MVRYLRLVMVAAAAGVRRRGGRGRALRAPSKRLVWFEHSAHNPPFEEPQAFVSAMMEVLR